MGDSRFFVSHSDFGGVVRKLVPDLVEDLAGDAYSPGVGEGVDPASYVHCVAEDVLTPPLHVAQVDPNAGFQTV